MNVKEYISSGVIESYVMGLATDAERQEFESLCAQYPEIAEARNAFELALEEELLKDAKQPPAFLKKQIEEKLNSSALENNPDELEEERTPVRRIGAWKWIAAASLLLMAGAVYWAVTANRKYENLQAENKGLQEQLNQSTAQLNEFQSQMDIMQHAGMKTAALKSEDNSRTFATIYWDTAHTKDVYLLINNLPQPASGKQYQLWALLNGQPVDLGMIEVKKRLLYQMKNVQNAQAFAITLEPEGGSPQPTTAPLALSKL